MSGDKPLGSCRWGTGAVPCRAHVFWLKHERTGKTAPIDVEPTDRGNIEVNLEAGTYRIVPEPERAERRGSDSLFMNHWVTCPAAQSAYGARPSRQRAASAHDG